MSQWIKWWKDKLFIKILIILLLSMLISLMIALINPDNIYCIVGALLAPTIGGLIVKNLIKKRLDKWSNEQ